MSSGSWGSSAFAGGTCKGKHSPACPTARTPPTPADLFRETPSTHSSPALVHAHGRPPARGFPAAEFPRGKPDTKEGPTRGSRGHVL